MNIIYTQLQVSLPQWYDKKLQKCKKVQNKKIDGLKHGNVAARFDKHAKRQPDIFQII